MGIFDNRGMFRGFTVNPNTGTFTPPIMGYTNTPIPMPKNATVFNRGRSALDNVYGMSTDRKIAANPPSLVRTANAMTTGMFNNRMPTKSSGAFVDPNFDNPIVRNFPQFAKIPVDQRQFIKFKDGKFVFELPEELEMGTQNETTNVPTNIPQFNTEEEYLKASGLLNQQVKQPTTTTDTSQDTSEKKRKGLLDQFKDFVKSDYGTDFAMGLLQQSGYSPMPQTLGQAIGLADEYATNKGIAREELDIKRKEAGKKSDSDFAYIVKDPNTGNIYNAYDTDDGIMVDVDGQKKPFRNNMFGGELSANITTVGNLGDTNITGNAFIKMKGELETQENSLTKLVEYMQNVDSAPIGMEKLATQFGAYMKTILGDNNLSAEQLKQKIIEGEFQGLIGANRVEVVGGGVMTEQDAARIMLALGGDPASISTNPDVVIGLMSKIFAQKYNSYKDALETYNINVTSGGFTNYPKKELLEFNDNFLQILDPSKVLALDLQELPNFSKNQLFRLLRNNTDAEGDVIEDNFSAIEISQIIELAKKYGINLKYEEGEIVSGNNENQDQKEFFPGGFETIGNTG